MDKKTINFIFIQNDKTITTDYPIIILHITDIVYKKEKDQML